jgi:hypothetical protein
MSLLLVLVSLAYLGFLAAVELWADFTGNPTISRRIQGWVRANVQLALFCAALAGWLLAHFSGIPA